MKKRIIALCGVAATMLMGCDGESSDSGAYTNHGFGWHYDEKTESGLRLRDVDSDRYSVSQYMAMSANQTGHAAVWQRVA